MRGRMGQDRGSSFVLGWPDTMAAQKGGARGEAGCDLLSAHLSRQQLGWVGLTEGRVSCPEVSLVLWSESWERLPAQSHSPSFLRGPDLSPRSPSPSEEFSVPPKLPFSFFLAQARYGGGQA